MSCYVYKFLYYLTDTIINYISSNMSWLAAISVRCVCRCTHPFDYCKIICSFDVGVICT